MISVSFFLYQHLKHTYTGLCLIYTVICLILICLLLKNNYFLLEGNLIFPCRFGLQIFTVHKGNFVLNSCLNVLKKVKWDEGSGKWECVTALTYIQLFRRKGKKLLGGVRVWIEHSAEVNEVFKICKMSGKSKRSSWV